METPLNTSESRSLFASPKVILEEFRPRFVGVDAVDLGDFVVAVGGEAGEETLEEFKDGETELRWDDGVK
ncbi:hypothetical protein L1987_14364 [Smallanthus sonchifolius]|uniref:Uncharacterized protein n=1 Tax=Smallanthus sonchifolius TaxID=185202 RepID=A0ACB9J4M2_9ASTR|nr:hypothetical protein L1987_14364 [Smallanthus sonchifolius]